MTIVFGSSLPETPALTAIGEFGMPGMSVMISFAPENWVARFSEKCSSILEGAAEVEPSEGVEDTSFGCAWAIALNSKPAVSAAATVVVLKKDMQGSSQQKLLV
ncbi:hypothetical protein D3C72_1942180 [compost metagenome]